MTETSHESTFMQLSLDARPKGRTNYAPFPGKSTRRPLYTASGRASLWLGNAVCKIPFAALAIVS